MSSAKHRSHARPTDPYRRTSLAYLRDLETRLKAYESGNPPTNSPIPPSVASAPTSSTIDDDAATDGFDDNPLTDGMTHLVITPSGQRHYLGNSSSTSFGLRLRSFFETFRRFDQDLSIEVQYPTYNPAAWPKRRPSVAEVPKLPPRDFAKRLYQAQYRYIGTIFSFVEPRVFDQRLEKVYSGTLDLSDREACLEYCQVLVILAYGQLYSVNQWDGHDGPPGFDYFMQALQFLPDTHDEGSVLFVEVLSLVGYFMQNLNRRDAAFLYIGLALRMAISLGLHQEIVDPDMDEGIREHRRRLWWSVYSMDRILCAKSGNPITILDEDIGVLPPSRLPHEPEVSSATVLLHYTELSRILGKIMKGIYRKSPKTGSSLVTSVYNIMTDLNNWRRDLPKPLQFDASRLDRDISRESVSTFLHYYQCINMTARPLLFRVVQRRLANLTTEKETDWRSGLSTTTIAVIEACVAAARDSTTMMHAAAKQNLVATYGFMDGEHIFSAAIVLVMANLAFPHNDRDHVAMEKALDVLGGMAEKGNGHIRARHELLIKLRGMTATDPTPLVAEVTSQTIEPPSLALAAGSEGELPPEATMQPFDIDAALPGMQYTGDVNLWEEGYGDWGPAVDFDWGAWTEAAQGSGR
ncbi:putative transcriptional regulatory protein [Lasiodiplodia theobromae]|uniref:Putative transcriptional regulatory protein n=1 Tax=Lasiodiplodia theobromae TaxID=45133 RepID=A0A5N5DRS0_9PEZI|nr:putative transcriptional regulatory protein [Lasiodiplodia theobromae]